MFRDFYVKRRFSYLPSPNPCKELYPDYYNCKKIEIVIKPNEMLFIPAGWFHFVTSEEVDEESKLNVAVSFFTEYSKCINCDVDQDKVYTEYIRHSQEAKINYEYYKDGSLPCLINTNNIYNSGITLDNLKKIYENRNVLVNKSNSQLFLSNYVKEIDPDCCQEVFMKFDEFLSRGFDKDDPSHYYLLQSNSNLNQLKINRPEFLKYEIEKNYCLWINFGNIYTGLHYDDHNNVIIQLQGSKKIILFAPSERNNLYLVNDIDPRILCIMKKNEQEKKEQEEKK